MTEQTPELILQSLPYRRDSAGLMDRLAHLPGSVFMDSGLGDQQEGRYDIISACPTVQLRLIDALRPDSAPRLQMRNGTDWQNVPGHCVFSACDELLDSHRTARESLETLSHLPFCGGLIGYFSYHAGDDALPPAPSAPLSDDYQRLERVPAALLGLYHWAVVVDHHLAKTQYFILPACPQYVREQVLGCLQETDIRKQILPFELLAPFQALTTTHEYGRSFARLKEYILSGDCYQTNLAIPFSAGFRGDAHSAYQLLRQRSRSPFSAWFNHTGSGNADDVSFSLLSLSPERFVSVTDQEVCTQPIKGTRKRSADPDEDARLQRELRASDKDRAENLMIVDLLRNDLGRVCETGSVRTKELFRLHSFSHVHHLISTITGRLRTGVTPMTLLKHCFPGGSITGAPKIRAMQIIAELETLPRSVYCGSMMYCDFRGNMDSSICIRTLVATQNTIYCWGGGGIVADSECEREHQECLDKVSALMTALPVV